MNAPAVMNWRRLYRRQGGLCKVWRRRRDLFAQMVMAPSLRDPGLRQLRAGGRAVWVPAQAAMVVNAAQFASAPLALAGGALCCG